MARLLNCHLNAIAALPAEETVLVLFDVGTANVSRSARRGLARFADQRITGGKKVLLFRSVSRLHARDLAHIHDPLSLHWAEVVRHVLLSAGVDDDRIFNTCDRAAPASHFVFEPSPVERGSRNLEASLRVEGFY